MRLSLLVLLHLAGQQNQACPNFLQVTFRIQPLDTSPLCYAHTFDGRALQGHPGATDISPAASSIERASTGPNLFQHPVILARAASRIHQADSALQLYGFSFQE
jgi:hypothetical protein